MLHQDVIRGMFNSMDKNKNGVLDHEEITVLCARVGITMPGEKMDLMLRQIDPDSTGEITFEELWDWYLARHNKRALFSATQLGVLRGPNATSSLSPLASDPGDGLGTPRNQVLAAIPASMQPQVLRAS